MKKKMKWIYLTLGIAILFNYNIVLSKESETQTNTVIEEGIYEIYTVVNSTKVIDIQDVSTQNSANAQIYERTNALNQKFKVVLNDDGTYTFFAMHSNKVLDVRGAGMVNYTNVQQYESNNTDAQKWIIQPTSDGYYNIISKLNGLYLDIAGGVGANCQNIQVYEGNGTKAQKFTFSKILNTEGKQTIEDGTYQIYSQVAENRLLEVPDSNTTNGATLKTGIKNNTANQKFKISYNNDGTYTITAMHSGKVIDVKGAGNTNATPVQQYDSNRNKCTKMDYHKK